MEFDPKRSSKRDRKIKRAREDKKIDYRYMDDYDMEEDVKEDLRRHTYNSEK
jgi:hypothetical protein